jgi:hypothetical protein
MEKHGAKIKKLLLGGILVVLLLPMIQQHVHYFESEPLKGHQVPAEQAWFSIDGWYNGWYQEGYEKWHSENIGFRNDLVRLHNQIEYSAFRNVSVKEVVVGKENYLYEENYLKAYTGKDYVGKTQIAITVERIKGLQDSLEKKGITLVICLAAGKASFFPEYIPDSYGPASDSTNYKVYSAMLKQKNVNLIDCNAWFMSMKGKTEFPLYPRTGIHWSRYGSLLVVDSLISWVEHKRNVDMPNVIWESTVLSDSLQSPDDDIGSAMNLIWPLKHYAMGYPVYHFEDTVGKAKVKMMTLSDSFFWSMFDIGLAPGSFEEISFYYYNQEVHHTNGLPMSMANTLQGIDDVERSDVVMIMATEATLFGLGWGFIDDAFNHFVLHRAVDTKDALIQKYESLIRMDETWMQNTQLKARENGISLDSMIFLDAKYMADEEIKNKGK